MAQALVSRSRREGSTGEPRSPCRHTRAGGPTFSSLTVDDLNGRFQPKRLYEASTPAQTRLGSPLLSPFLSPQAARSRPAAAAARARTAPGPGSRRSAALWAPEARGGASRRQRVLHRAPRPRAGAPGLSAHGRSPSAEWNAELKIPNGAEFLITAKVEGQSTLSYLQKRSGVVFLPWSFTDL